jgi:hypothetical protein
MKPPPRKSKRIRRSSSDEGVPSRRDQIPARLLRRRATLRGWAERPLICGGERYG